MREGEGHGAGLLGVAATGAVGALPLDVVRHELDALGPVVAFLVAILVRYLWILSHLLRGKEPEQGDPTKSSSAL